jgi:RND family efflux transporter MFP subunit
MKTKIITVVAAVLLLGAAGFKLKTNKNTVEANIYRPDHDKKILVQAEAAQLKKFDRTFSYTGTFAPYREVMLIPQVHGEVDGIYFNEGDVVRKGKLLLQIDDDLLQAQYVAADANYWNAKRNLERYQNASLSGGVSKIQLDNLQLSLINASAQRSQLAKQLALSKITAPFDGTITLRNVEPGSVVGANAVARITDLSKLKLEIAVPEKEVSLFQEGGIASVKTEVHPDEVLQGTVDYVSKRADEAHTYTVRILIDNTDTSLALKAGMYGTASIQNGAEGQSLVIPRAALLGSAKNPQVFITKNNTAMLCEIQTSRANHDYIEVLYGLQPGDTVVTSGHINLAHGSPVQVSN